MTSKELKIFLIYQSFLSLLYVFSEKFNHNILIVNSTTRRLFFKSLIKK